MHKGSFKKSATFHLHGDGKKRPFQLTVANRLWGQKDYGFLPEFTKVGKDHYGAGLEEVDFIKASAEARKTINSWVAKQTKDKIKEFLPQGILTADSRLVLTNAIYFKAAWAQPFNSATKLNTFHLGNEKTVKVKPSKKSRGTQGLQELIRISQEKKDA